MATGRRSQRSGVPPRTLVRPTAWLPATTIRAPTGPRPGQIACLSAAELRERLTEEINRAERHGTPLSCLLVTIGNLEELAREHGSELSEQTLAYVGRALGSQVRGFDRIGQPERRRAAARAAGRRRPARRDRRPARARAPAHDQGRSRRHAPAAAHLRRPRRLAGRSRQQTICCEQARAGGAPRQRRASRRAGAGRAPRRPCLDGRTDRA